MVRRWKEEQAAIGAPLPEIPEELTTAMHRSVGELWAAATRIATREIEQAKTEAHEKISTAEHELAEYSSEITRLEAALEQANAAVAAAEQTLAKSREEISTLHAQQTTLSERLADRDAERDRLQADYATLQKELLALAQANNKK